MTDIPQSLKRDRAIRNAALELFKTDLEQVKADFAGKGLGERVADRLGEGARDMAEEAVEIVEQNPGRITAAIAAGILWFFRAPLLDWVANHLTEPDDTEPEPTPPLPRSDYDN